MADKRKQQMMKSLFGDVFDEEEEALSIQEPTKQLVLSEHQNDEAEVKGQWESKSTKKEAKNKGKEVMHDENDGKSLKGKISKDKPVCSPLKLEVPLHPPPAQPDKMILLKHSNIFGIAPKPFDPKTYVEEEVNMTDEFGSSKRMQLTNNIVRWREVQNPDGTITCESNAYFVKWSNGTTQLIIGNEALDVTVQDVAHQEQHLFLRQRKGILQSQGRLLNKMIIMPSSLSSNSHQSLASLFGSQHQKVSKVKSCVAHIDPEKEIEEIKKAMDQVAKANEILERKQEKMRQKCKKKKENKKKCQLSHGFLKNSPNKDEELENHNGQHYVSLRSFEEDLEKEAEAKKCIINAKRSQEDKDIPPKSTLPSIHSCRYLVENKESEEKAKEPKQLMTKGSRSETKGEGIMWDDNSPLKSTTRHRRKAYVYESDDE